MKATLRPGASMRARDARPYGGGRSVWRAEVVARASLARRVVAPYGEVLQTALRPYGVAANPLPAAMAIGWQTEGVTYFYARSAS